MKSHLHITTVVLIAAGIWGVLLFIDGVAVQITWLKHFHVVAVIVIIALLAFDKWLWRWKPLKGWFVKRPYVWGTWRVVLRSDYKKPGSAEPIPPIEGYMAIWQEYAHMQMRLFTAESSSETLAVERLVGDDGLYTLAVVYRNMPKVSVRERSPIHLGGMLLTVEESPEPRMSGQYWTDRKTSGEIELKDRQMRAFQSFASAERAFSEKS